MSNFDEFEMNNLLKKNKNDLNTEDNKFLEKFVTSFCLKNEMISSEGMYKFTFHNYYTRYDNFIVAL